MSVENESQHQSLDELMESIPERSQIDYMLRTTKQHQTLMFQLADQKASILTGISMVLMTLTFGQLKTTGFMISLAVFGITNIISAIIALTAVIPSLPRKGETDDKEDFSFNPLFFGHTNQIPENEFVSRLGESLKETGDVYEIILRDLHQLGRVAGRKFARVRVAYRVMLFGLILSVIALGVEIILDNGWVTP